MRFKSTIMEEDDVRRTLVRMTHEIIEKNQGVDGLCLLGVKRRGVPLAEMIAANILRFEERKVPVGYVDITLYRDDLTELRAMPDIGESKIPCDINGRKVVIVDDVIYTGRTARAALDGVLHHGRPACVQLAVLIDRGHRELPIRPDYVGKNIPTSKSELVSVMVPEVDGKSGVSIYSLEQD